MPKQLASVICFSLALLCGLSAGARSPNEEEIVQFARVIRQETEAFNAAYRLKGMKVRDAMAQLDRGDFECRTVEDHRRNVPSYYFSCERKVFEKDRCSRRFVIVRGDAGDRNFATLYDKAVSDYTFYCVPRFPLLSGP